MFYEQTQMACPYRSDWHRDNQPTTEASGDVGQDVWPYGYSSTNDVAFLMARLKTYIVSSDHKPD